MVQFSPHGNTRFEIEGLVIVLRPDSSLNEEEIARLWAQAFQAVPGFAGERWAMLYIAESAVLLTPEAEKLARQALEALVKQRFSGLAMVIRNDDAGWLIEAQMRRIYSGVDCELRVFAEEEDARCWLDQYLGDALPAF